MVAWHGATLLKAREGGKILLVTKMGVVPLLEGIRDDDGKLG